MRYLLLLTLLLATLAACETTPPTDEPIVYKVRGETMGTYYQVSYTGEEIRKLQQSLDSLLVAFNEEVSTYVPESTVSRFNRSEEGLDVSGSPSFLSNYQLARDLSQRSGGALQPTIMPLVNYWGFGYTEKRAVEEVDSLRVDSLMALVGMDKLTLDSSGFLRKSLPGVQLDFSATAKGDGVDLLAAYLTRRGLRNYLVDIGGELSARGRRSTAMPWLVGISTPDPSAAATAYELALPLEDEAIATSGNYRNFYENKQGGYGHTINPRTGYPERNTLLSATVFAPDCATADGFATACMVLGPDLALDLIESQTDIEAYLLLTGENDELIARYTSGMEVRLRWDEED
ncbi:MAG: FAD:protein FMN transferase [Saprospiraceae bacterium]